jgi:hypothetical protein
MKTLKTILFSNCLLLFSITNLLAQQGTNASGGEASGSGGSASFTIGQTDYISATGSGGKINQGIQQPYEILVTTGIDEKGIDLTTSVYPNPTTDFVLLKLENCKSANFTFQLYNIQGKIILNKKVESNETTISMADLADAIYFIKVLNNDKEVKIFKIIKN